MDRFTFHDVRDMAASGRVAWDARIALYESKLIAADICKACGFTDSGTLHDVTARVELAMDC